MKFERGLSAKNLKRKPARTAALILLAAFLSFSILGGSLIVMSLRNGLRSYESRLGADIVVVPKQARSHGTVESIILQGIPGYFYMDKSVLEKVQATQGVQTATPQFYLASASSGCCSVAVQIIGFDPETDFSIQPWIRESYSGTIGDGDIIVGCNITVPKNRTLKFYNVDCNVAAKLDKTGTGLDNAVYANMNTIHQMMEASVTQGFDYFSDISADRAISSVMIKVADGYDIEQVTGDINIHVRKIEATQAKNMVSGIASGLTNVSNIIGVLTVVIWVLAIVILIVAFVMISHERTKEFAVLRVIGASRKMLSRLMLTESAIISAIGAAIGAAVACLIVFPFSSVIKDSLELPYLMPPTGTVIALIAGAIVLSVVAGSLTSAASARRISKIDTGLILREGA
ncbi:MAG: ABC transporter permease [Oscillospiraceae bacterium]|nr:ABC transporter permease [Oscillospiraceae bacterium]